MCVCVCVQVADELVKELSESERKSHTGSNDMVRCDGQMLVRGRVGWGGSHAFTCA